ncbi:Zn(2)-C6 fungal-type domain-containing protein [Fusarium sp. LHS14.1]|nr:Zn(2)-C6 fungal-type domain-containing protein [Fusarium sp. LHS14.1]
MDPAPPDTKRPRLSSWPAGTPQQGVSLPHPHPHHGHPNQLPPPPPPPPPGALHHPGTSPYQHYPPRSAEHSSAPPTPAHTAPAQPHPHPDADRRHHEQEPYPPVQDYHRQQQQQQQQQHPPPHQPPPSPAHPAHQPYPPYGSRDPPIKRDPGEDQRRPNSTGHAPEGMPSTPHLPPTSHPPPPPPPGSYDNPPRHMNYESAPSMPPTPGGYRAPSFPPPTPVSHQPSYEQHGGYPSGHEPFYSVYSSSVPAKKKNTRASQACDSCRQLKAKCDETKPCKTCKEKGVECKYRDPVPKATDKAQADILEGLTAVQSSLSTIMSQIGRFDQRLVKMESLLPKHAPTLQLKTEPATDDDFKRAPASPYVSNGASSENYYPNEPQRDHPSAEPIPLRMMPEDEMEVEPGPPVPPGEPAIPINHTTLAGLLLEWPSIRELTKHHLEQEGIRYISEYPISQEQNRGVLIVYGRGEDSHPSRHIREPADHGNLDMADDSSDMASPSPAADWGQLGGLSPPDQVEYKGGVLAFDGNPDFSEAKVWSYVESFKDNILNMHPIIQPKLLDYWVRHFLDTLPAAHPRSAKPQTSKPAFAVGGGSQTPETAGSKRKRSPGPDGSEPPTPAPPRAGRPDRSIHSALVLTVLALGKICLYRDNVPDVVHSTEPLPHGSPAIRNGAVPPSPNQGSPPGFSAHSHSSGLPSPKEQDRNIHSRRSSIHGVGGFRSGFSLKKNYEVIPGLEYFAYATDILGNHTGAYNNMKNVYANIFAGLYHGQLGRPMESFAFIHKASHKLQVIMRPSLDKMRRIKRNSEFIQETKYNQLALTFWTCLQLESDLIAEMQLPPSGLLSYEDDMPHPNMSLLEGYDQRILDSYPGQLYLRTHLNSIHRMFYAPEDPTKAGKDKFRNVGVVSDAVSGMHWVAPSFAFREDDPPADDILAARLRAKYWGAQVITYRPFIRQILQFSHSIKNHASSPNFPNVTSEFRQDITAPVIHPKARTHGDIDPQVVELAKKGIKALIESTRAFHGLGEKRPIITNVFGTAHAQWGNLLVLSAAFKDPVLHSYVDEELLRTLFHKTIQFLRQSATATSSLRTDMHILEGLQRDLFMYPDPRTASSFSSGTSAPGYHTPRPVAMAAPPQVPHHMNDQVLPRPMPHHLQQMSSSHGQ